MKRYNPFLHFKQPWGYFIHYNPTSDDFALKEIIVSSGLVYDDIWIYYEYQETALDIIFKDNERSDEKKLLNHLNKLVKKLITKTNKKERCTMHDILSLEPSDFTKNTTLETIKNTEKLWNQQNKDISFREYQAICLLLLIDQMINDCKHLYLTQVIADAYCLDNITYKLQTHYAKYKIESFKDYAISIKGQYMANKKQENIYIPLKNYATDYYTKVKKESPKRTDKNIAEQIASEIENGAVKNQNGQILRLATKNPTERILKWIYQYKKCFC